MSNLEVLAYSPHPDDAELCCGGTLALLADKGYRTGVIDLTRGELASRGSVEKRVEEAKAASELLGLSLRENLALPDGGINAADQGQQLRSVVKSIRQYRPELLLAPYLQARHPDHGAASELITRAVFFAGLKNFKVDNDLESYNVPQVIYYQMRYQFHPSFLVDISSVSDNKYAAIESYASQVGPAPDSAPKTLVGSALSLYSVKARDAFYGSMLGVTAAEAFAVRNALGVKDPLEMFRNNRFEGQLYFPEVK